MPYYNMTELYAATTGVDLVIFANNATSQFLSASFVIAVFFVAVLVLKRVNDFAEALLGASFMCFILSILFRAAGLLNFYFIMFFLVIIGLDLLYLYMNRN